LNIRYNRVVPQGYEGKTTTVNILLISTIGQTAAYQPVVLFNDAESFAFNGSSLRHQKIRNSAQLPPLTFDTATMAEEFGRTLGEQNKTLQQFQGHAFTYGYDSHVLLPRGSVVLMLPNAAVVVVGGSLTFTDVSTGGFKPICTDIDSQISNHPLPIKHIMFLDRNPLNEDCTTHTGEEYGAEGDGTTYSSNYTEDGWQVGPELALPRFRPSAVCGAIEFEDESEIRFNIYVAGGLSQGLKPKVHTSDETKPDYIAMETFTISISKQTNKITFLETGASRISTNELSSQGCFIDPINFIMISPAIAVNDRALVLVVPDCKNIHKDHHETRMADNSSTFQCSSTFTSDGHSQRPYNVRVLIFDFTVGQWTTVVIYHNASTKHMNRVQTGMHNGFLQKFKIEPINGGPLLSPLLVSIDKDEIFVTTSDSRIYSMENKKRIGGSWSEQTAEITAAPATYESSRLYFPNIVYVKDEDCHKKVVVQKT
jgi:hypothetical protein